MPNSSEATATKQAKKRPTLDRLLDILRNISLFLSIEGQPFASFFSPNGLRTTYPLHSAELQDCLIDEFLERNLYPPDNQSLRDALQLAGSTAREGAEHHPVAQRIAAVSANGTPTRIVIDLANDNGEVLLIDRDGWAVSSGEQFCFTRNHNMRPLPHPIPSALQPVLATLRRLLNPATEKDWNRLLVWILSAFRPGAPCPVLVLQGPPSSGKSTVAHMLRMTIDPAMAPYADPYSSSRDLTSHARRNWLFIFDNILRLTARQAQFVNSLATGLSVQLKQSRDAHQPVDLQVQRPIILTVQSPRTRKGEDPLAAAGPGLPERALRVNLAPLTPERNRPCFRLWPEFHQLLPQLLAVLSTGLSTALRNLPEVDSSDLPHHPDAAAWALAAAPALGLDEEDILAALEPDPDPDSPFALAIREHMSHHETWTGSATALLNAMGPTGARTPKGLSQQLRRNLEALEALGIHVAFDRKNSARRIILSRGASFTRAERQVTHRELANRNIPAPPRHPSRNQRFTRAYPHLLKNFKMRHLRPTKFSSLSRSPHRHRLLRSPQIDLPITGIRAVPQWSR
jgi:hypothetical protein